MSVKYSDSWSRIFLGSTGLQHLERKYLHKHLHVIADNLSAHKHAGVQALLSKKHKVTLRFTPTYSSWLNQVEIGFNILTRDVLNGGTWHWREELVKQPMAYISHYNATRAHPFTWLTGLRILHGHDTSVVRHSFWNLAADWRA